MALNFAFTADNRNFRRSVDEIVSSVQNATRQIEANGGNIDRVIRTIASGAAALGVATGLKEFVSQIATVRGEFQQFNVAFETMLGSAEKAQDLMAQLTKTAVITPFGMKDVTNGAKSLLAYGTAAEEVNETLVRLGDIAAGMSLPLNDLVMLYGTTMVQGRMFTQDLRQFQGRGIPIVEELAKQFGVAENKVGDLVTAGKVGAKEFQAAIWSMTDAGSKFGGLMEAQSKTITGQISNIEDAVEMMFNDIGESSEGLISGALTVATKLVENWQAVGVAVAGVMAAFGIQKLTEYGEKQTALKDAEALVKAEEDKAEARRKALEPLEEEVRKLEEARALEEKAKLDRQAQEKFTNKNVLDQYQKGNLSYSEAESIQKKFDEADIKVNAEAESEAQKRIAEQERQIAEAAKEKEAARNTAIAPLQEEAARLEAIKEKEREALEQAKLRKELDDDIYAQVKAGNMDASDARKLQQLRNQSAESIEKRFDERQKSLELAKEELSVAQKEKLEIDSKVNALNKELTLRSKGMPGSDAFSGKSQAELEDELLDCMVKQEESSDRLLKAKNNLKVASSEALEAEKEFLEAADRQLAVQQELGSSAVDISVNSEGISQQASEVDALSDAVDQLNEATNAERGEISLGDNLADNIDSLTDGVDAMDDLSDAIDDATGSIDAQSASEATNTGATAANTAAQAANTGATNANTGATSTNSGATNVNTAAEGKNSIALALNTAKTKIAAGAKALLTSAINTAKNAWNSFKVALATNPFGMLLTVVSSAISLFMAFKDETEEVDEATERFGEKAIKTKSKLETLFAVIGAVNKDSKVYKDSLEELCKIYEEYGIKLDKENDLYLQLIANKEKLIQLIMEEGVQRQRANKIESLRTEEDTLVSNFEKDLKEKIDSDKGNEGLYADIISSEISSRIEELRAAKEAYEKAQEEYNTNKHSSSKEIRIQAARDWNQANEDWKAVCDSITAPAEEVARNMGEIVDIEGRTIQNLIGNFVSGLGSLQERRAELVNYYAQGEKELEKLKPETKIEYTADMDTSELLKAFHEASNAVDETKKKVDELDKSSAKPTTDNSEINNTKDKATEAKGEVENLDKSSAAPTTDNTDIDKTKDKATEAKGKVDEIDNTTATPKVNTTWLDDLIDKARNALTLLGLLGGDNKDDNKPTSAIDALKQQRKNLLKGGTNKEIADYNKSVNDAIQNAVHGSEEEKTLMGLLIDTKSKPKGSGKTKEQIAAEQKSAQQKILDLMRSQAEERLKLDQDYEYQLWQNRIDLMEDGEAKVLEQMKLDQSKELSSLEEQKKSAVNAEIARQKAVFDAQQEKNAAGNKKYTKQVFDPEKDVKQEAIKEIEARYETLQSDLTAKQKKAEQDRLEANKEAMNAYLKEFGNYQEKRQAIEEEYNKQIKNAQNDGQRMMLMAQRNQSLANLDFNEWQEGGGMAMAFGDISKLSGDTIKNLIAEMEKYRDKVIATFDPEKIEKFEDALNNLRMADVDMNFTFAGDNDIVESLKERLALQKQIADEEANTAALQEQKAQLEQELNDVLTNTTIGEDGKPIISEDDKKRAEELRVKINSVSQSIDKSAKNSIALNSQLRQLGKVKFADIQKFSKNLLNAGKNASQLASIFSDDLAEAIDTGVSSMETMFDAFDTLSSNIEVLAKAGKDAVKETVDSSKTIVEGASGGMKASAAATATSLSTMEKASAILAIIGAAIQLATMVASLFNKDKKHEKNIQRLQDQIDALQKSYDKLGKAADDAFSTDASNLINQQNTLLQQQRILIKQQMAEEAAKKKTDKEKMKQYQEQLDEIDELLNDNKKKAKEAIIGEDIKSAISEFASAYAEAWNDGTDAAQASMKAVKSIITSALTELLKKNIQPAATKFYDALAEAMGKGYLTEADLAYLDSLKAQMDALAAKSEEEYKKIQDRYKTLEELQEDLTDISFDSVSDNFKSLLSDMESSTKDFTDSFTDMLRNALIQGLMDSKYDQLLKDWYAEFAKAMEGGELTDEERERLRQQYDSIVQQGLADRDAINAIVGGNTYSQEASKGGWGAMAQDTAEELNGRFTALTELNAINNNLVAEGNNIGMSILATLQSMVAISGVTTTEENPSLLAIKDMMFLSTGYLEDIAKYTKQLNAISSGIDRLNDQINKKL